MKAIVGLGNPGPKYERTRHNVGFWTLDVLAKRFVTKIATAKFQSLVTEVKIGSERVLLVKPQTYMNLSGHAVQACVHFYKLDIVRDVVIVYDDMDFSPGQLKLREGGRPGGHNGIKSIVQMLGTESFCRMRLGIGRPEPGVDVIGHVLGTFASDDAKRVEKAVDAAADAVVYTVENGFARAMNQFNQVSF